MKYQQTSTWFFLPPEGVVQPFDGEAENLGPSWSHGLTHLRYKDGSVSFCGQNWFEDVAVPLEEGEVA